MDPALPLRIAKVFDIYIDTMDHALIRAREERNGLASHTHVPADALCLIDGLIADMNYIHSKFKTATDVIAVNAMVASMSDR